MSGSKISVVTGVDPLRRPLLGIVFFYLAGICGGVWFGDINFVLILVLALVALSVSFGLHKAAGAFNTGLSHASLPPARNFCGLPSGVFLSRFSSAFLFIAVFFAGWSAVDLRVNNPSERHLSALMQRPREGVGVIGLVSSDPVARKVGKGGRQYWSFKFQVDAVSRLGYFQSARGEILVNMSQFAEAPSYGERWQLNGALIDRAFDSYHGGGQNCSQVKKLVPNRFVLRADRISGGRRLESASSFDLFHWCFRLRQKCSAILARGIEHRPDVIGILNALVLGRKSELPPNLREAFMATGTYHIFAISGQHVAIIALFVVVILQVSGVCRVQWFYYLAPALVVFTIMTGMSTSATRGCLMALLCFLGPLFRRRTDVSSAIALAALLIVGADPMQLFQPGFILSFGIVAGLVALCPPLMAAVEKMTGTDPYQLEPEKWGRRRARSAARWLLFMLIASIAAWFVSTPLIARWFNLVSPVALIANICVIPFATIVLLAGCLAIIFGWCCPLVAEAFNFANVFFVSLMSDITLVLARVPFGHVFVKTPPVWFVGLWFILLIIWRLYYRKIKIWLAAFLILLLVGICAWLAEKKEWEIHALNVDRSAVCLVKSGGRNILINCGPRYRARNILRYLRKNGVNDVQTLFCPRPDSLHAGAATEIAAAIRVNKISRGTNRLDTHAFGGKVTVDIEGDKKAPMIAKISIGDVLLPVTVEVEERGISGTQNNARGPVLRAQFRVVCQPVNEEMTASRPLQIIDLQSPARIDLGPSRGVVFSPDKKGFEIRPVSLYP